MEKVRFQRSGVSIVGDLYMRLKSARRLQKMHYGSQTEIMAKIVQEKLVPKQARGMRR